MQYFALLNDLPDRNSHSTSRGIPMENWPKKQQQHFFRCFNEFPNTSTLSAILSPGLINVNEIDRPTTAYRHRILKSFLVCTSKLPSVPFQKSVKPPIVFNVPSFDSPIFTIAKNNARSHLMCLTRAAPAGFRSWACILNFLISLNFVRLFFSPLARKIIFDKIQLNQKV